MFRKRLKHLEIYSTIMKPIVRTHTYFMTFKEYKRIFLKEKSNKLNISINNNVLTRTHIIFD